MDERSTPAPSQTEQDLAESLRTTAKERQQLQLQMERIRQHVHVVREDEIRRVEEQLQHALLQLAGRPDFSAAATACHRAYQHALRADVLAPLEDLL